MAERELAREAGHDVPGLAGVGEEQEQSGHGQYVIVGDRREAKQDAAQGCEQENHAPVHDLLPTKPRGRMSSTIINSAKLNMLFAEGVINKPARASETPMSTPPMSAPDIEPRPPTITITKARSV